MREEEQLKTTSASRVLFSSARLWLRDLLLPYVQAETPWIARFQGQWRTPFLDRFFMTASFIGSHVFYMLFLPMCFWFGYARFGRLVTSLLATSLYVVNIVKDFLCLPRPISPPVVKLSSDYKMEYGFPSAHAVNCLNMAVSSALYYVTYAESISIMAKASAWIACISFITIICLSRVYCGMHTMTDIIGGLAFGAVLQYCWANYYFHFDAWITLNDNVLLYSIAMAMLMVVMYPDPVDPTPSFDDAISFVWVVAGVASGTRFFSSHPFSDNNYYPGNVPYSLQELGLVKSFMRVAIGVAIVLTWRLVAKHVCRAVLPPIYRAFDLLPTRRIFGKSNRKLGSESIMPSVLSLTRLGSNDSGHKRTDSNGSNSDTEQNYAFHRIARFDVDVVTRGVVYFGIGWLSCAGIPILFDYLGLAPSLATGVH